MIIHGDCIEQSEQIESGSVDLILTDPPYGTVKNAPQNWTVGNNAAHIWDDAIQPKQLFEIANRILRKNGKLILFSQEPYTSELITNAIANLPFGYRMVWEKNDFANALLSKKAPVSYFEDILVFSKNHDYEGLHPLREYFKQVIQYIGLNKKTIIEKIGQRVDHTLRVESTQFSLCTEETYNELIQIFGIDKMQGFKSFEELEQVNNRFNDEFNSVFNLWEGKKYKSNILKYKKDYSGHHPTQKPVALLEDLIKTYSNEDNLVVDLTCGSGSTAVAAIRTNRRFVVIEKEEKYFNIAKQRIEQEQNALKLF